MIAKSNKAKGDMVRSCDLKNQGSLKEKIVCVCEYTIGSLFSKVHFFMRNENLATD